VAARRRSGGAGAAMLEHRGRRLPSLSRIAFWLSERDCCGSKYKTETELDRWWIELNKIRRILSELARAKMMGGRRMGVDGDRQG
jgi:hypothetical protein